MINKLKKYGTLHESYVNRPGKWYANILCFHFNIGLKKAFMQSAMANIISSSLVILVGSFYLIVIAVIVIFSFFVITKIVIVVFVELLRVGGVLHIL